MVITERINLTKKSITVWNNYPSSHACDNKSIGKRTWVLLTCVSVSFNDFDRPLEQLCRAAHERVVREVLKAAQGDERVYRLCDVRPVLSERLRRHNSLNVAVVLQENQQAFPSLVGYAQPFRRYRRNVRALRIH